jgi:hypothetical protein
MPSEIRSIGPTIRRLAKGTIDLVRWRAPVQLLKYATRTVWFKNVNTGYPVDPADLEIIIIKRSLNQVRSFHEPSLHNK